LKKLQCLFGNQDILPYLTLDRDMAPDTDPVLPLAGLMRALRLPMRNPFQSVRTNKVVLVNNDAAVISVSEFLSRLAQVTEIHFLW
jgi:hypothetical protein